MSGQPQAVQPSVNNGALSASPNPPSQQLQPQPQPQQTSLLMTQANVTVDVSHLTNENVTLKREAEKMLLENHDLKRQKEQVEREKADLQRKIEEYLLRLADSKVTEERLTTDFRALQGKHETLQGQFTTIEKENESLKEEVAKLRAENTALQAQLASLRADLTAAEARHSSVLAEAETRHTVAIADADKRHTAAMADLEQKMTQKMAQMITDMAQGFAQRETDVVDEAREDRQERDRRVKNLEMDTNSKGKQIEELTLDQTRLFVGQLAYTFEEEVIRSEFNIPPEVGAWPHTTFAGLRKLLKEDWSKASTDPTRAKELRTCQHKVQDAFKDYEGQLSFFDKAALSDLKTLRSTTAHPPIDLRKKGEYEKLIMGIDKVFSTGTADKVAIANKLYELQTGKQI